jgi:excisionase family DNA binding protein
VSERLLTTRQVAERFGVVSETILRWVRCGRLPAIRISAGAIRFRESEIEAWLDEHTTADGADREAPATRDAARLPLVSPIASHQEPTEED